MIYSSLHITGQLSTVDVRARRPAGPRDERAAILTLTVPGGEGEVTLSGSAAEVRALLERMTAALDVVEATKMAGAA